MGQKKLKDISWNVTEEVYRADPAYSYSTLARFNREGFEHLATLFDRQETPSLTFGSIVDTLLTGSKEEFDERFVISDLPEISDNLATIAKLLFNSYSNKYHHLFDIPDDILSTVGAQCDYYSGSKWDTLRVKKIKEGCSLYYSKLYLAKDKTLISQKDYDDAVECANSLKTDPMTKWYFDLDNPFDEVERNFQLKFKGEYMGIPLRCMADLLIVDYKKKIILPCDLKTTGKLEDNFYKSFIDWNYWIQAQLYWYLIRYNLDQDPYFKDFTLKDYRFIVINRYNRKPLVWDYSDTKAAVDCSYGRNKQYLCKNWRSLVCDLHYYLTHEPKHMIGISPLNDITEFLNKV